MMLDEDGSGMGPTSKGTGVEDMESSGSGFGPDDEDSQVGRTKNKGKPGIDSDEDEDDIDNDDEDDETNEDNEEFGKDKLSNNQPKIFPTTSTSTSTTTTTTENYDETRTPELVISINYLLLYYILYNNVFRIHSKKYFFLFNIKYWQKTHYEYN